MEVVYLCDRRACGNCSPECSHTTDISHAKNFKMLDKTLAMEMTEEEKKPTTPEEFAKMMQELANDADMDREAVHVEMDCIMMNLLIELGYEEGVKIFHETDKWYA